MKKLVLLIILMLPLYLFSQFVLTVDSVIIKNVSFTLHKKNWISLLENVPSITIFCALENSANDISIFNEYHLGSFYIEYRFQGQIYREAFLENLNNCWETYSDDSLKKVHLFLSKEKILFKLYSSRFLYGLNKSQKKIRKVDYTRELAEILPTLKVCCEISQNESICVYQQNVIIENTNLEEYYKSTFSRKKFDRLLRNTKMKLMLKE